MEMKWYIDSWAPLEGVVFASHRACSSDVWDVERIQTIRMAAPYFEPENVSRAMAFGAAQRGFQEQFSIDGEQESGFDTLELLGLFVRRTYLGGGSGPTGNDGDGPPLPPGRGDGSDGLDVDRQSLKGIGEKSDFRALMSDIQELTADQRARKLHSLVRARQDLNLKAASEILRDAANLTAITRSQNQHRLRAIASALYPLQDNDDFWYPIREERHGLSLALKAPLPKNFAHTVGLPLKILTMMDALSFLAADRRFLNECSVDGVLPLLLAVSANFCSNKRAMYRGYRSWHSYRDDFIRQCCVFIAEWLPFDELPDALANVVSNWNDMGAAAQRGL
ncbi:hypothetical protein [Pseudomonas sp. 22 E 5]|nr:hypothetical protein [Pseudomonas sp. 22 E 5]